MVEQCNREIRTISHLLHPPLLDELGLRRALQDYVEGFAGRSAIVTTLAVAEDLDRLPAEIETALFRVVQESLGNIHRHSGSTAAAIRIRLNAGTVRLEMSDEGGGFRPGLRQGNKEVSVPVGRRHRRHARTAGPSRRTAGDRVQRPRHYCTGHRAAATRRVVRQLARGQFDCNECREQGFTLPQRLQNRSRTSESFGCERAEPSLLPAPKARSRLRMLRLTLPLLRGFCPLAERLQGSSRGMRFFERINLVSSRHRLRSSPRKKDVIEERSTGSYSRHR